MRIYPYANSDAQSRLTTWEPLEPTRGSARKRGGVREIGTMVVSYFSCVRTASTTSTTKCGMRRILWDFGRAAVQPGGSHGVALLSHRRGSSSVCAILYQAVHLSCTCTRRSACMRARDEGRDATRGTYLLLCKRDLLFVSAETEDRRNRVLTSEKIISTVEAANFGRCRELRERDTMRLTKEKGHPGRQKGGITVTANFSMNATTVEFAYCHLLTNFPSDTEFAEWNNFNRPIRKFNNKFIRTA